MDFIYILNEQDEDALYEIGQILNFTQDITNNIIQVQIRRLKHYEDFATKHKLDFFYQANLQKDEVCVNNLIVLFTYIAMLASSLLYITNRNYFC